MHPQPKLLVAEVRASLFANGMQHLTPEMFDHYVAQHPVTRNNYFLPTPPVKIVMDQATLAVMRRYRGQAFYGESGMGKTVVVNALEKHFRSRFPNIPVFRWDAETHGARAGEKSFHADILTHLQCRVPTKMQEGTWTDHVAQLFIARALEMNATEVILMVDEAQNYGSDMWRWYKALYNRVHVRGIQPITFAFGDAVLKRRRDLLSTSEDDDLINRFLGKMQPFRGIRGEDEVREVLAFYDALDYPKGSGISFAAFFRPDRVREGWAMTQEATALTEAIRAATGLKNPGIGMEPLSLAINEFLISYPDFDSRDLAAAIDLWQGLLLQHNIPCEAAGSNGEGSA